MPDATTMTAGQFGFIEDAYGAAASHNLRVYPYGSQTINGSSSYTLSTNYGGAKIWTDGANVLAR